MVLYADNNISSTVDSFLGTFFQGHNELFKTTNSGFPKTDIYTKSNKLYFDFALAGWDKEDIDIDINPETSIMTIKSNIEKSEATSEDICWLQRGLGYRNFTVKYVIPSAYDKNSIDATFQRGILSVSFTKNPEMEHKQIKIK